MYSPFRTENIRDLVEADVGLLKDIPEGWFVEYKESPCSPKDYAKAVSAFANSYGGWLFIGLAQNRSDGKPAGGPGLPMQDAQRLLDSARDSISQHLSPSPYFEMTSISGPIPALSIPSERAVLVIKIPKSSNTPHIHSSGRIYRRQVDSSDPVAIVDRAELDGLYERNAQRRNRIDEALERGFDLEWTRAIKTPWLHVAMLPDPDCSSRPPPLEFERFRELNREFTMLIDDRPATVRLGLDDVYASSLGFVARNHRAQVDPDGAALTLECTPGAAVFLTIPLSSGSFDDDDVPPFLRTDKGGDFRNLMARTGFNRTRVVDGTQLAGVLYSLGGYLQDLVKRAPSVDYIARIRMWNLFRTVPFFESGAYLDWCGQHSVPVIHRGTFSVPSHSKEWLTLADVGRGEVGTSVLPYTLLALGLPPDALPATASEALRVSVKFHSASPS